MYPINRTKVMATIVAEFTGVSLCCLGALMTMLYVAGQTAAKLV